MAGGGAWASALQNFLADCWRAFFRAQFVIRQDKDKAKSEDAEYHNSVIHYAGQHLSSIIDQKIDEANKYAEMLDAYHEKRFGNIKGPLYDTEKGWNPAYRLRQSDLMSAMPSNPFLDFHAKMDIPRGIPYPHKEEKTVGYLPFKWIFYTSDGKEFDTPIVADPIIFEAERARKRA